MEEYRQTLLGRALADVLQDIEREQQCDEDVGDEIFALFDQVMRSEFAAAEEEQKKQQRQRKQMQAPTKKQRTKQKQMPSMQVDNDPDSTTSTIPLYTHQRMTLTGTTDSFNRYMDKWSLQVQLPPRGVVLDRMPVELAVPEAQMLVKLHKKAYP